ncbi:MBL fold metallo-hydrolase [Tumebacillus sp. DT12]|uniref:MBL fold metallo-hydrolase n=1 Tax=Tumebacillus lacus TaxID=2995335 RepID=A0ABT3WYH5_9BACL|nr:MBL fold metallo-hydrolase [Tumebacillus lacus]MCX7569735.1 MBL fold metallo-hydrolase [Tumebacillus lacus]
MILQKLPWAGVLIEQDSTRVLIDPIGQTTPQMELMGEPRQPLVPLTELQGVAAVLITHLHDDHFDAASIKSAYGADIPVFVPERSARYAEKSGLTNVIGVREGDSHEIGSLTVTATHSMDGFGFPQVSYVVEGGGKRVLHSGDTIWHGYWWKIAKYHRPDVVCLPCNGPLCDYPDFAPSHLVPAALTPEQAVEAAHVLQAGTLVPIHYDTFYLEPYYVQAPDLLPRLQSHASARGVNLHVMQTHDQLIV